jgi:hypothetical protein
MSYVGTEDDARNALLHWGETAAVATRADLIARLREWRSAMKGDSPAADLMRACCNAHLRDLGAA